MRSLRKSQTTEWAPIPLTNGWVSYGPSDTPMWRIQDNHIEFRGAIKNGTLSGGSVIAWLPIRISQRAYSIVAVDNGTNNVYGHVYIDLDGTMKQDRALAGNTFVSLVPFRIPIFF